MILSEDNIADAVEQSRLASGFPKSAVAAAAGTSRSALDEIEKGARVPRVDTFLRVLHATGRTVTVTVPTEDHCLSDNQQTLASFADGLDSSDPAWIWRSLISDFVANEFVPATRSERRTMLHAEPGSVGSVRWDSFIAALAEHLTFHAEIEPPEWVNNCAELVEFWWPVHGDIASMKSAAFAKSPASFRRRRILIDGTELPEVIR